MVKHAAGRDQVRIPESNAAEEVLPNIIYTCLVHFRPRATINIPPHSFSLLQLSDIDEDTWSHKQLDLPNEIWLMCLTFEIHIALVKTDTNDTSKLVDGTEKRHNTYHAATHLIHSTLPTSDITAVVTVTNCLLNQDRLLNPSYVVIGIILITLRKALNDISTSKKHPYVVVSNHRSCHRVRFLHHRPAHWNALYHQYSHIRFPCITPRDKHLQRGTFPVYGR